MIGLITLGEIMKVYVLLTQHDDRLSRIIKKATRADYNHVSIGIVDNYEQFYTFNQTYGFYIEHPTKIYTDRKRERKCCLYFAEISDESYLELFDILNQFVRNSKNYKYTLFGLIMCFFRISYHRKNTYFCSQFVAELLQKSGAINLKKKPSLIMPNDFTNINQLKLRFIGTLGELSLLQNACI